MRPSLMPGVTRRLMSLLMSVLATMTVVAATAGEADPPNHGHSQHATQDQDQHAGHDITPAQMDELRGAIASYRALTDEQIRQRMRFMPPDFERYLSPPDIRGETGVLLLAHGMGEVGNRLVERSVQPIADVQPTAVAFGMSMHGSGHVQKAVEQLVAAGVRTIVAVPTVTATDYNTLKRQWEFLLGLRATPAYATVPVVQAPRVRMAPAFDDHELISRILLEHAREIGRSPAAETVVVVGHGPEREDDNRGDLALLQTHARWLREHGGYAAAEAFNLQDDAPAPVRQANVERLRDYLQAQAAAGRRVLVVGALMTTAGIQRKITKDLEGLDYAFNTKGLSEHPLFTEWVRASVEAAD